MNGMAKMRLLEAWHQCERHLHHLKYAMQALKPCLPVTPAAIASMNDETVQDWDQFVLRFTRLQDTMGVRLYPALLDYLQEPYEDRPMLDKLHRLEGLYYLSSVDEWNGLRGIRNSFAHDYPQDDVLKAAYLNEAVEAVALLEASLERIAPVVKGIEC